MADFFLVYTQQDTIKYLTSLYVIDDFVIVKETTSKRQDLHINAKHPGYTKQHAFKKYKEKIKKI